MPACIHFSDFFFLMKPILEVKMIHKGFLFPPNKSFIHGAFSP